MTDLTLPFEIRAQVYTLLANLFLAHPQDPTLAALRDPDFIAEFPMGRGTPDVEAGLARLAEVLPTVTTDSLKHEFYHLFGTLGPAAAPPWESVYLDREHVLLGEDTLKVRALYARFGLAATDPARQPDDHIGLQLHFLASLAARAAERLAAGDEGTARTLLEGQRECLEAHLLRWADQFTTRSESASETGFYGALARLTLGLLRFDLVELSRQLAAPSLN